MESSLGKLGAFTKEISKMIHVMVLAKCSGLMETHIEDDGKMASKTAKDNCLLKKRATNTLEFSEITNW